MGQNSACEECCLKCLVMHGRKTHSASIVHSFFKVILDDQFSELFVPPEFAPSLMSLVNKETLIEDVHARKWEVKLSYVKGRLAFAKGWRAFALDHGIKIGDFVVLHYIKEDHFVSQIFGRSACERTNFPAEANVLSKKRMKTTANHEDRDDLHDFHGKGLNRKNWVNGAVAGRTNSEKKKDKTEVECVGATETEIVPVNNIEERQVATVIYDAEPLMMDWDAHFIQQCDDGNRLLDLSELEFSNPRALDKTDSSHGGHGTLGYYHTTEKGTKSSDFTNASATDAFAIVPADHAEMEIRQCANHLVTCRGNTSGPLVLHGANKLEGMDILKDISEEAEAAGTCTSSEKTESIGLSLSSDGSGRILKSEPSEGIAGIDSNNVVTCDFNNKLICVVKPEPADFSDVCAPSPLAVSCVVTQDSDYYLEMPTSLPSAHKSSSKSGKKVVFLRDPCGRLWPTFYLEKHDVKVMSWGWRSFRETNQIQAGDECVFAVENEAEGFYTVEIIRKLAA